MRTLTTRGSRFALPALVAAALLGSVTFAHAAVLTYAATLTGPNESPPNASPGIGSGQVDVNTTTHQMHVFAHFSGLTGNTTASHIHAPTAVAGTGTASVATTTPTFAGFPLGVKFGEYDIILDLTLASSYNPSFVTANGGTTAGAEAALLAALAAGKAYLNIHSSTFGGGEIRGFLTDATTPAQSSTWGRIKQLYR
jgi:CHRD domain-containing protein